MLKSKASSLVSNRVRESLNPTLYSSKKASIYVHWPYCKSICPYCDFNRYLIKESDQNKHFEADMSKAFLNELASSLKEFSEGVYKPKITSIFFGGGTPSLANPDIFYEIINHIKESCITDDNLEVTMEANPTSAEIDKFKSFREAGINRLSLGIQSLRDDDLKYLGRNHSAEDAIEAVKMSKSIFPRVSFDLIYSRHNRQTPEMWKKELVEALNLGCSHISLYNLTIEGNTLFHRRYLAGKLDPIDDNIQADLYDVVTNEIDKRGMYQYEVSNFCFVGNECTHNLNYWTLGDYIGIGPGASSRMTINKKRNSTVRIKSPQKWKSLALGSGSGTNLSESLILTNEQSLLELLMVGLRITKGINQTIFQQYSGGLNFQQYFGNKLDQMIEEGFLYIDNELTLKPTKKGLKYHDAVLRHLL